MRRQMLHILPVFLALLIPLVDRITAIACTALIAFAVYSLYHWKKGHLLREHELEKGYSLGIVFYPISVLLLMLLFPMEIAVAAWAIMAFGDGFATIVGKRFSIERIPWNEQKSFGGLLAFVFFATLGAAFFLWYLGPAMPLERVLLFALLSSFAGALIESAPLKIEDNLSVPLLSGLFLYSLSFLRFPFSVSLDNVLIGLLLSSVAAFIAISKKAINKRGAAVGAILSVAMFAFLGFKGFLLGLVFFVLGSMATKFKQDEKAAHGLGHGKKIRSGRNVIANSIVAVYCAFLAIATPYKEIFLLAFTAAVAAASSDTLSSELGQVFGKKTVMVTTFKPAKPGVNGAISLEGTMIGLLGAMAIALLSFSMKLVSFNFFVIATLAGFFGMLVDSLLGATLENTNWLGNNSVNFLCTLSAALLAITAAILGVA